jgi:hypothetical protein
MGEIEIKIIKIIVIIDKSLIIPIKSLKRETKIKIKIKV